MLTMRPVRLQKKFLRELVNTSLKKYLGQRALRGIAGNNPSVRKSGTRSFIGHILSIVAVAVNSIQF